MVWNAIRKYRYHIFNPIYKILYEIYHCPWPLSDRNFVCVCKVYETADGLIWIGRSMEMDGIP